MTKYLDETGLSHLWAKIKSYVAQQGGGGLTVDDIYPVGSIYMSVNNTNPGTLFAGTTWTQIKDTFLLSAGDTYAGGATGGAATVTLSQDQTPLPSHKHGTTITQPELNNNTHSHNTYYTSANRGSGSVSTRCGPVGSTGTAISTNSDTHTHTLKTNVAVTVNTPTGRTWNGSGVSSVQPHNNMPPYLAVYMWQRTA